MSEITIHVLGPERLDDFLHFFDHIGFTDNPAWASCYCHSHHFEGTPAQWDRRTAPENRAATSMLIQSERMHGFLAYEGSEPVGWCHAAPRSALPGLENWEEIRVDDAGGVGSVVCFVVAPAHRRRGVARMLLRAACESFARSGFALAEAYPRKKQDSEAQRYEGPLEMYIEEGFTVFRETASLRILRKRLSGEP